MIGFVDGRALSDCHLIADKGGSLKGLIPEVECLVEDLMIVACQVSVFSMFRHLAFAKSEIELSCRVILKKRMLL